MAFLNQLTAEDTTGPAKAALGRAQVTFGFVPNIYSILANSPLAVETNSTLTGLINKRSSLSRVEQQVAQIAASLENSCSYCVAAHTTVASGLGVSEEVLAAIRSEQPLADRRLEAIRATTIALVRDRGRLPKTQRTEFLAAGFAPGELLDLVTIVAFKTITNYTNHLADTPLDEAFQDRRLQKAV